MEKNTKFRVLVTLRAGGEEAEAIQERDTQEAFDNISNVLLFGGGDTDKLWIMYTFCRV